MSARTVSVGRDVLAERRAAAERFRAAHARRGTLVVQLISSPGTGKTGAGIAEWCAYLDRRRQEIMGGV